MGLYLCVFAQQRVDEEVDGVEVGGYDDFHVFRSAVAELLESGTWGSRFPVLMDQPDSRRNWTAAQAEVLERELLIISDEMIRLPPMEFWADWQRNLEGSLGLERSSLLDCFVDVDGEPIVQRLIGLANIACELGQDIWFQ